MERYLSDYLDTSMYQLMPNTDVLVIAQRRRIVVCTRQVGL